ncbi:MAG TPA: PAS domain S-box protein [Gemmata sp.]|nr:PAS domain S-box protein [Gemmata sp.]
MASLDQAELGHALFAESGDALFLLDPETDQLIEVNPVAERVTGFTRDELLQFPATYLFRFEAAGGLQRLRSAFSKTMAFHGQEGFLLRAKDDAWVPVSLTVSRLHVRPKTLGLVVARDDRERRQAFGQIRRVEAELRQVLASSPAALWSAERAAGPDVTTEWQFRYVSPLLDRLAGRPADFFDHPFKWAEAVHPADREAYRARLHGLLAGIANESEIVYRAQAPDGTTRWVQDKLQVVRDATGRPARLDGCLVDVTEHREVEESLRQSERRFRALVEKSRDGIALIDAQGVIRYATPSPRGLFGREPADVEGRPAFDFLHPDDLASARDVLRHALAHPGEDVPHRCRAAAADGSYRVIELNACNRLDDPSVGAVVINFRDVTDREAAAREAARQHALLQGLFASVPDVICYKDRELRFLGGNPAFEELAGRPMRELVGRTCEGVFPTEWADRLRAVEETVLRTGETVRGKEWVAYPDGRQVLLDIVVSPLHDPDGDGLGLIVTGRDVTEQNRLEDQLRQAHKLEAVGRLAGGIAHDFNNLLTVVLGNLELIRAGATGDEAEGLLAATDRAAQQAANLTRQMLGFARRQPLRTAALDLSVAVRDALGLLRRTIDPRVVFRVTTDPGLWPVAADPVQLQQIVMNLCLNARDAMPEGGTLSVEAANAPDVRPPEVAAGGSPAAFVRLSVSDTGVGMTDEVKAKVFEPFFTTKDVGQGTGLGLAVVYGVARAHGGWVECASTPGSGSRFDVYLPRGVTSDETTPAPVGELQLPRGRGETVLVADDEPMVRSLARGALQRQGYRVLEAADGAEAVEVFRREAERVAVVVLDVSMPNMSGRQAYDAIRVLAPAVRVIFASGHQLTDVAGDGDASFLHKPYTPRDLAAAVRAAIDSPARHG